MTYSNQWSLTVTKSRKIFGVLGVLVVVSVLGAAISNRAVVVKDSLSNYGVAEGALIRVLDNGQLYKVQSVNGWRIVGTLPAKTKVEGSNRFVFNLEVESFQVYRRAPAKKK